MLSVIVFVFNLILLSFANSAGFDGSIIRIFLILLQTVVIFYDLSNSEFLRNFQLPLVIGYLFRLFLLFFDIYGRQIYVLPNASADADMFYEEAVLFVTTRTMGTHGKYFSMLMGEIFSFIGTSKLFGQYILMLFSIVSIIMLAYVLKELDIKNEVIYGVVGLVGLLPNFAILSSVFLRESIVTMLISISLYCYAIWIKRGSEVAFVMSLVVCLCGAVFHSGSIGLIIGFVIARMFYDKPSGDIRLRVGNVGFAVLLFFALSFLYLNYGNVFFGKLLNIENISDIGSTVERGGSSYARYVGNSSNPLNMIIYTIPRIIYFLFSPFPWQWRGISDVIAFVFSAVFYFISVKNIIQELFNGEFKNKNVAILFLIIALCGTFVFAWGTTNTGTASRHRDKMIILYSVLYAISRENRENGIQINLGNVRIL